MWSSFKLATHQIKIEWQIRKSVLIWWCMYTDNISKRYVCWGMDKHYSQGTLYSNIKFILDKKYPQVIIKKWKWFFFNPDILLAAVCFWLIPLPCNSLLGADILYGWPYGTWHFCIFHIWSREDVRACFLQIGS